MLVEVIELYFQGEKLPREARRRQSAARGKLTVDRRWTHKGLENAPLYADLIPYQLETLCQVKLRYWRGRNVVLSGYQKGPSPLSKRSEEIFEQWWWCRLLNGPEQPTPHRF